MIDLEDRLRDELLRTAQGFEPSADLTERIGARIERRTQRNRLLLAAAAVVVVVAGAGGLVSLGRGGDDRPGRVDTAEPGPTTTAPRDRDPDATTTTAPATSTTEAPPDGGAGDTTTTTTASTPAIDGDTPLSRWGIGPIRAGMTIPEAEEAGGVRLTTDPGSWVTFGRTCGVFTIEGLPGGLVQIVARTPGLVPSDDPRTAVIDAVGGRPTQEGIDQGSTVDEVSAVYGEPTDTVADELTTDPNGRILLYEEDGYRYGFRIDQDVVTDVSSGHVRDVWDFEPCQ